MLSITDFQNLVSKKQQELENERLSKLQQKQSELQQLEEQLSKVQKYRPFDPQRDWKIEFAEVYSVLFDILKAYGP